MYDPRLRPPVHPHELMIDPLTGMKNYIANDTGGWATSSGYVRHSLTRAIHFGRVYTSGPHDARGREEDLFEALRCLGQALHCLEDFTAHSNYVELVLRELGFTNVFPHVGAHTEMEIGVPPGYPGGRRAFPLITGTFGSTDFAHSVLGEAQDKFSQSEVEEMDLALQDAHEAQKAGGETSFLKDILGQIPNASGLASDVDRLEQASDAQEQANMRDPAGPASASFNPLETVQKIYPILEFRDKVMRAIEKALESIPGLTALVEKISETLTLFVMSLLAPYIRPLIARASTELKFASSMVIDSAASHQYEPWTDPYCTDPTHSMLSKDHFSHVLNAPAGEVATAVVTFVVPRVLHAFENPGFPADHVINDIIRVLHHPTLRDPNCDIQTGMFRTVEGWVQRLPDRGRSLDDILGSDGVREGRNHLGGVSAGKHSCGHAKTHGGNWDTVEKRKKKKKDGKKSGKPMYDAIPGLSSGPGGAMKIGGVNLPGPIGGVVGGLLDAGMAGFMEAQGGGGQGRPGGGYPGAFPGGSGYDDGEKKKKKKKDK